MTERSGTLLHDESRAVKAGVAGSRVADIDRDAIDTGFAELSGNAVEIEGHQGNGNTDDEYTGKNQPELCLGWFAHSTSLIQTTATKPGGPNRRTIRSRTQTMQSNQHMSVQEVIAAGPETFEDRGVSSFSPAARVTKQIVSQHVQTHQPDHADQDEAATNEDDDAKRPASQSLLAKVIHPASVPKRGDRRDHDRNDSQQRRAGQNHRAMQRSQLGLHQFRQAQPAGQEPDGSLDPAVVGALDGQNGARKSEVGTAFRFWRSLISHWLRYLSNHSWALLPIVKAR